MLGDEDRQRRAVGGHPGEHRGRIPQVDLDDDGVVGASAQPDLEQVTDRNIQNALALVAFSARAQHDQSAAAVPDDRGGCP
ncbi:Uncharacterised protein [Mycobacteroides abscessus subsp. abscessus]|nr:Uncharacterised protein [Mycobacteroides abscessus subsp. abscessus]